jgi:hypothetical protein
MRTYLDQQTMCIWLSTGQFSDYSALETVEDSMDILDNRRGYQCRLVGNY